MITDLSVISDKQLALMKNEINERGKMMLTQEGKKESRIWALKLIDYLLSSGYKLPDASKDRMAVVYADQLSEAIVIHGYDQIQKVVREWIKNDTRQYKAFPTAGDILDAIKNMLGNPAAEIARREHEEEVRKMVERERAELMKDVSEEHIEELKRRYEK